jgi:hypothetical protein
MATTTNWDTLYGATAPTSTYLENVATSGLAHQGISIIGTGNGLGVGGQGVQLMGVSGIALPALDILAPFANVENINFALMAAQVAKGAIRVKNGLESGADTPQGYAYGCSISHCGFEAGTTASPMIYVGSAPATLIEGCSFRDCLISIRLASASHTNDCNVVRGNHFTASSLALISHCIGVNDNDNLLIIGNAFAHGVPTSGAKKYIVVAGTANGSVVGNYFAVTGTAMATNNTLGSLTFGANWGMAGPYIT